MRLSFLDVFCNALGWSQDQAPGMQVPAGNRPLSDPLLPVFLWAGCSRVIGRLHTLSDSQCLCSITPRHSVSRSCALSAHADFTQMERTGSQVRRSQWSSLVTDKDAPQSPWFLTHRESALREPSDLSRLSPVIAPLNPFPAMGPGQFLGF